LISKFLLHNALILRALFLSISRKIKFCYNEGRFFYTGSDSRIGFGNASAQHFCQAKPATKLLNFLSWAMQAGEKAGMLAPPKPILESRAVYIPGEGTTYVACSPGVSRFRLKNKAWVACRGQSLASKNIRLNINDTNNVELLAAA